jgi:hypothetical protein
LATVMPAGVLEIIAFVPCRTGCSPAAVPAGVIRLFCLPIKLQDG